MSQLEEEIRGLGVYEVEQHEYLPDIGSDSFVLRHKKSGARIALLPNEDSNKVFYIAFRTPPKDSTGVAHIIEHTVLCGSRDFPVKDPFIEVVKGSLNTFLNAMTYPDKTVYPVASTNEKDFDNLMHIYLDAVFHPNIYTEENIFRQEGWHYEVDDGADVQDTAAPEGGPAPDSGAGGAGRTPKITVNGVVYNEMKGVMSSPDDVLNELVLDSLFPDTIYAIVSGGDPEVIPELTYEQYLNFHRTYYHPCNSYIYLYGDMDMVERLRFLDEKYLSEYERIELDSAIRPQTPFAAPAECAKSYSIQKDEDPAGKAFLSWNAALPMDWTTKDALAFRILDYCLCDAEGAPVKEALRDAGIGQDVESLYEPGLYQAYYSITAKYTDPDRKEEFLRVIRDTLTDLAENGLNPRAVQGAINYYEFQYREADFGSYPKGLIYGLDICDTWLYNDSRVWTNLQVGKYYEELRSDAEHRYFEDLIRRLLLENPHRSVVLLTPEQGLTEKMEAAQEEKMAAFAASLSPEELQQIRDDEASLRAWQETPDSEEAMRTIPILERSDLKRETVQPVNEDLGDGITAHPMFTNGIDYVDLTFDVTDLSEGEMQTLSLLKSLLCALDTVRHGYAELDNEINLAAGGMSPSVSSTYLAKDPSQYRILFGLNFKALDGKLAQALALAQEILLETSFDDADRIREILEEEYASMKAELPASGHTTAVMRAASYLSECGKRVDTVAGIGAYRYLGALCDDYDAKAAALAQELRTLAGKIITRDRLSVDITADKESIARALPLIGQFRAALPEGRCAAADPDAPARAAECAPEEAAQALTPAAECAQDAGAQPKAPAGASAAGHAPGTPPYPNEGFTTAGQVQYVCRAGNFLQKGLPFTGALRVLKVIMGYDYLWTRIRMKGGAYGCMSSYGRDGYAYFVTYRDPHLKGSIETFEGAAEYVRSFDCDERTMTKYVIGAVSGMDRPMTPSMLGRYSKSCRLMGLTAQDLQRDRDQVLGCTPEDIRSLADYIDAFMSDGVLVTIGSAAKLAQAPELFGSVEAL